MAIDIHVEKLVSFPDEAETYMPNRVHRSTWHRWRLRGIRGVKLETILIGGKRYTSLEALQRFVDQTTAAADGLTCNRSGKPPESTSLRNAESELTREGL